MKFESAVLEQESQGQPAAEGGKGGAEHHYFDNSVCTLCFIQFT